MDPILLSSESDRWFTPKDWMAEWEAFLGPFMDPCPALAEGEPLVDGLSIPWVGAVGVNPPFSRKLKKPIEPWITKWCTEPLVTEGLLLVPSRTGTRWFQRQLLGRYPMCLFEGRGHFSGHRNGATFDSVLVYRGPRPAAFAEAFGHRGGMILAAWPRRRAA